MTPAESIHHHLSFGGGRFRRHGTVPGFQNIRPVAGTWRCLLAPGTHKSANVGEDIPRDWDRGIIFRGRGSLGARKDVVSIKCSVVIATIIDIGLGVDVTGDKRCCLLLSRGSTALHASSQCVWGGLSGKEHVLVFSMSVTVLYCRMCNSPYTSTHRYLP